MKVTFVHHSSFIVELKEHILLFDYFKGELPEFSRDKKLCVFSSHRHYDHFDKFIFKLADEYENIQYILSKDIEAIAGGENPPDIIYMDAHEEISLGDLKVKTLYSTDEGVAFYIVCEGKIIYHAGDLNWWHWEGEPAEWNIAMERDYIREIQYLKGAYIDVAFLPLDNNQGESAFLGIDYFMRNTDTQLAFPMHLNGTPEIIQLLKQKETAMEYRDRIQEISKDGQEFIIGGKK
jgi:L-ascorbate metabolism protein UlaG (beta-lactamase superfamily)